MRNKNPDQKREPLRGEEEQGLAALSSVIRSLAKGVLPPQRFLWILVALGVLAPSGSSAQKKSESWSYAKWTETVRTLDQDDREVRVCSKEQAEELLRVLARYYIGDIVSSEFNFPIKEDAFLFDSDSFTLQNVGRKETPISVAIQVDINIGEARYVLYHNHPFGTIKEGGKVKSILSLPFFNISARRQFFEDFIPSPPSEKDIKSFIYSSSLRELCIVGPYSIVRIKKEGGAPSDLSEEKIQEIISGYLRIVQGMMRDAEQYFFHKSPFHNIIPPEYWGDVKPDGVLRRPGYLRGYLQSINHELGELGIRMSIDLYDISSNISVGSIL